MEHCRDQTVYSIKKDKALSNLMDLGIWPHSKWWVGPDDFQRSSVMCNLPWFGASAQNSFI